MTNATLPEEQIAYVGSFEDLVSLTFRGQNNAACWRRNLAGDFAEIVRKAVVSENITTLDADLLNDLVLSPRGNLARETLLRDLKRLEAHGAAPTLNLIQQYESDDSFPLLPTDVYSYHVDRSPVAVDTFLCTYYGAASDILLTDDAIQKVQIPEIRHELVRLHGGEEGFDAFLAEYFFDLHYQPRAGATPVNLGLGHLWRLAIDHPQSQVPPCVHRAPRERDGESRLLLIC